MKAKPKQQSLQWYRIMFNFANLMKEVYKRGLRLGIMALCCVMLSLGLSAAWWGGDQPPRESSLPPGNAITDGKALLRYALPIDNPSVRSLQKTLEGINSAVKNRRWSAVSSDISKAATIIRLRQEELLESFPEERQPRAQVLLSQIQTGISELQGALETQDRSQIEAKQEQVLDVVGQFEALMVSEFPFEVPAAYQNLPQLKGRATVKMETEKGSLVFVVDGYNAPVTAGNFVDLVERGFYNGLPFIRSEESYVLQAGDPPGPEQGFIDPATGQYRNIPLEFTVRGDQEPTYGITLEEAGRYKDQPVLPFSAYGTVAMARPESDPDGGSSQFFFFLFEPELTPAGLNLLDGRYSVFGYVTEGTEVLEQLKQGDKILTLSVIDGLDNLVRPSPI